MDSERRAPTEDEGRLKRVMVELFLALPENSDIAESREMPTLLSQRMQGRTQEEIIMHAREVFDAGKIDDPDGWFERGLTTAESLIK
jgi:hypothetical protein